MSVRMNLNRSMSFRRFLGNRSLLEFQQQLDLFRNCSTAGFVNYFWQLLSVSYTFVVNSDTVVHWVWLSSWKASMFNSLTGRDQDR